VVGVVLVVVDGVDAGDGGGGRKLIRTLERRLVLFEKAPEFDRPAVAWLPVIGFDNLWDCLRDCLRGASGSTTDDCVLPMTAGQRQAQRSSPLLLWLLLLGGLAAEGRRLGDCYADIGTSMPYAASPGCWSTTGSTGAIIHGRRGGGAIKSRQDGTRSRVLEATHEWRGSMGRVKCSRRGGTDGDGDGVCGRRGLYVFLPENLVAGGGTKLAENTKPFSNARPDSDPASAGAQMPD
jgi:hypothetical protein